MKKSKCLGSTLLMRLFLSHMLQHVCIQIFKCNTFHGYFEINDHKMRTRNNQCLVKLLKIKLEYAHKSFRFMGANIYNELPVDIRKIESLNAYEQHLKQHFT